MQLKHLFLLRHAKSSWDDTDLADHDRPLSARGQRDATLVEDYLQRNRVVPAVVLCSSATRTQQTLEKLAPAFGTQTEVLVERGLYGASADMLLARLTEVREGTESVMLIGHNPGVGELALALAATGRAVSRVREKFPTAALATLAFGQGWRDLAPQSAELVEFVRPKDLRDFANQRLKP